MMFSVSGHRFLIAILLLRVFTSAQDTASSNISSFSTDITGHTDTVTSTDSSTLSTETGGGLTTTISDPLTTFPSTTFPTTSNSFSLEATSTSSSTSGSPSGSPKPSPKKSNAGAIAGGVLGTLAGLGVIAALILLLRRRGFFDSRGGSRKPGGPYPPSPRLKNPWVNGIGGGVSRRQRPQRLESVGGESVQTSPPRSNQGHGFGNNDDAHELGAAGYPHRNASASALVEGAGLTGQTRSSKASVPEGSRVNSRTSYDLNVFNSNMNVPPRGEGDPFASETSVAGKTGSTVPSQTGDLARTPSGSRVTRKPAPKYDESDPTTPITPRESKPPVSRPPRTRTYSNSSSGRASATAGAAGGGGSSRSSLEHPQLSHRSSQATLGGTFKFAGEKEGPVHYLMPDAPTPAMQ